MILLSYMKEEYFSDHLLLVIIYEQHLKLFDSQGHVQVILLIVKSYKQLLNHPHQKCGRKITLESLLYEYVFFLYL